MRGGLKYILYLELVFRPTAESLVLRNAKDIIPNRFSPGISRSAGWEKEKVS